MITISKTVALGQTRRNPNRKKQDTFYSALPIVLICPKANTGFEPVTSRVASEKLFAVSILNLVPRDRIELPSLPCKSRALPLDERGKFGGNGENRTLLGHRMKVVHCHNATLPYRNTLLGIQPKSGDRYDAVNVFAYGWF